MNLFTVFNIFLILYTVKLFALRVESTPPNDGVSLFLCTCIAKEVLHILKIYVKLCYITRVSVCDVCMCVRIRSLCIVCFLCVIYGIILSDIHKMLNTILFCHLSTKYSMCVCVCVYVSKYVCVCIIVIYNHHKDF